MKEIPAPWPHQVEGVARAKDKDFFGLFFDVGTGKTRTLIDILRDRFNQEKRVLKTIIFAPPIVVPNWKSEWVKYSSIDSGKILLLTGSGRERLKKLKYSTAPILVTNYESLNMKPLFEAFKTFEPEVLVFDELHYLKDKKSKRSKKAFELSKLAQYRYGLTGTPVLNSPLDLFMEYKILDHGKTFGGNFFAFRSRYFVDKNAGMPSQRHFPHWQIIPGALEEINRLIKDTSMVAKKNEVLDLPPFVQESRFVEMLPVQEKHYKEMQRDFITYVNGDACVATMALTKALRLMQIASGFIKVVDGEEIELTGNPKQDALEELLTELTPNHKVLVWAAFKQNYRQIRSVCEKLKIGYVEIHGDISPAKKQEAIEKLNTDPAVRVLIGHPQSGGIGCNLTGASYSIFYSRSYSLGHDTQAEGRNYRGGSEIHERITRIDLITQNTIEEVIVNSLANKQQISDKILGDLITQLETVENQ